MMRKLSLLLATFLVLAGCSAQPEVSATDLWVKSSATSLTGGMSAVYGTLTNNSGDDIVLTGGQTDAASVVEVHEMAMINGQMKMQEIDGGLAIPAGQSIQLAPGGDHLMLMGLTKELLAGDEITVTFSFSGVADLIVKGVLAKPAEGGDEEYHSTRTDMEN
jgi:copper(I)-binding protein